MLWVIQILIFRSFETLCFLNTFDCPTSSWFGIFSWKWNICSALHPSNTVLPLVWAAGAAFELQLTFWHRNRALQKDYRCRLQELPTSNSKALHQLLNYVHIKIKSKESSLFEAKIPWDHSGWWGSRKPNVIMYVCLNLKYDKWYLLNTLYKNVSFVVVPEFLYT